MTQLTFKATDEGGQPLPKAFLETLYLSSLGCEPFKSNLISVEDGRISLVRPAEPFQAVMVMPVEGFGAVYAHADNKGQGFGGKEKEIDLGFEAARARIFKVRKWIEDQERGGFGVSSGVQERLDSAERYLQKAERAEPRSKGRTAAAHKSLGESLWAGEMAILEKAKHDIANRGWRDGFLFGCNCFGHPALGPKYDELFLQLFNYATVRSIGQASSPDAAKKVITALTR